MEFKDKVKYVRRKLYLSQEMMAKELGVAFATVNRWESGRCHPNYRAQRAFAEFCKPTAWTMEELDKNVSYAAVLRLSAQCSAVAGRFSHACAVKMLGQNQSLQKALCGRIFFLADSAFVKLFLNTTTPKRLPKSQKKSVILSIRIAEA